MRTELKDLEGGLAFFTARIKDWQEGDGHRDYLLQAVKVWPWDGESRVGRGKPIRLDHLWHRVRNTEANTDFELLSACNGVGRVGWYARRDGSIDLGLKSGRCICLDNCLDSALGTLWQQGRGIEREEEVLDHLAVALVSLDMEEVYAYSRDFSRKELRGLLRDRVVYFQRLVDGTKSRLEAAPKGPKPKGLDLPLRNCRKMRRLPGVA